MRTISFLVAKGGVSKSSLTLEVAALIRKRGHRVLVIDLDQQCSISKNCNADLTKWNILDVMNARVDIHEAIQDVGLFDIIVANGELAGADRMFDSDEDKYLVADVTGLLSGDYDYVLIDVGPSRNILHKMALVACDYIVIPTLYDESSLDAVVTTKREIEKYTTGRTKCSNARVIGYVLSSSDNTILSSLARESLGRMADGDPVSPFVASISRAVRVSEAKSYHTSVTELEPSGKTAGELGALTGALLGKMDELEGARGQ